jgi:phage tail tube protein FII
MGYEVRIVLHPHSWCQPFTYRSRWTTKEKADKALADAEKDVEEWKRHNQHPSDYASAYMIETEVMEDEEWCEVDFEEFYTEV